jgi:hypothetical protein
MWFITILADGNSMLPETNRWRWLEDEREYLKRSVLVKIYGNFLQRSASKHLPVSLRVSGIY